MDQTEQLRNAYQSGLNRRKKPRSNETTMLGDVVRQLMEGRVSPRQARFESIACSWSRLLPAELYRHCKLADISAGQLKVIVDSPSYMHELRLCSSQLLRELQRLCPRARIKKIKFAIG